MDYRGGFILHNTLGSTENPAFNRHNSLNKQSRLQRTNTHSKHSAVQTSPQSIFSTPESVQQGKNLSELGDSSSLFSYDSPASFDFGAKPIQGASNCPIPFVFGTSRDLKRQRQDGKMVNERSLAKAPLHPVIPNEQSPRAAEGIKPLSSAPQFGETSLPQSPLFRAPPKEKSVFVQPKNRPEHHREPGKSSLLALTRNIANTDDSCTSACAGFQRYRP